MEFHQLKTFITVAETKNVTRAASRLNTTPPSVSNHIRQLEKELDVTLFTRTPKGMKITSQGEALCLKALDILTASDEFYHTAKTLKNDIKGHVSLGINADSGYLRIPDIIKALYHQYPGINLEIVTSSSGEILKWVEAGKLDCGFVFGSHDNSRVEFVFLSRVDLVIAIPVRFKQTLKHADIKDIAALPWIFPTHMCPFLNQVRSVLDNRGIELTHKVFANDDVTKYAFIDQGIAVSVLEKHEGQSFAKRKKVFFWQGPEKFESTLSFAYSKHQSDDLLIKTITAFVKDAWKV